jgi:PAS domain-containing protein
MSKARANAGKAPTNDEQASYFMVEAIPTLVWRAGPDGKIDYVNRRVLEYLGASR